MVQDNLEPEQEDPLSGQGPGIPNSDFQALFKSAPGLYLGLKPGLTIMALSESSLRATMTRREEILGRHLFGVFPVIHRQVFRWDVDALTMMICEGCRPV